MEATGLSSSKLLRLLSHAVIVSHWTVRRMSLLRFALSMLQLSARDVVPKILQLWIVDANGARGLPPSGRNGKYRGLCGGRENEFCCQNIAP
jgi:hypothetical protein